MKVKNRPTGRGHIIIVVPHLVVKGGGYASLAQLSVVMRQLGYKTYFALWDSKMSFVLRRQNKKNIQRGFDFLPSPLLNTISVPSEIYWIREEAVQRATSKDKLFQRIRKKTRRIFEGIWFVAQNTEKLLHDAELVLFGASLGKKEIDAWRRRTAAPLIMNHAGSLENIARVSLTRSYVGESFGASDQERYIAFFSELDGVLFQADTQEKEFHQLFEKMGKRAPVTAVASPPCDELAVLSSKLLERASNDQPRTREVLCIGSYQSRKNQLDAIIIIQELLKKNWRVKLRLLGSIGEHDYEQKIRRYIHSHGLQNTVEVTGYVENPLPMIRNCDLVLQTSTSEGQSRVLREAMYSKTLVATYQVSGTDSLFSFHDDCISAPFGNTKLLADRIEQVWNAGTMEDEIVRNAYARYLERNSESAYRHKIEDFISSMRKIRTSNAENE